MFASYAQQRVRAQLDSIVRIDRYHHYLPVVPWGSPVAQETQVLYSGTEHTGGWAVSTSLATVPNPSNTLLGIGMISTFHASRSRSDA